MVQWLNSGGCESVAVSEFGQARRELEAAAPDLLIADIKLEAYNGLHLAIWARARGLNTRVLVVGDTDPVLQQEAERERATYLSPPLEEKSFLKVVESLLSSYSPARRSLRKRVELDAEVAGVLASVVDLSYEGVRLEMKNAQGMTLPAYFTLRLPAFDIACRVQRVWLARPQGATDILLCGAVLPTADSDSSFAWRGLVDRAPFGDHPAT